MTRPFTGGVPAFDASQLNYQSPRAECDCGDEEGSARLCGRCKAPMPVEWPHSWCMQCEDKPSEYQKHA